MFIFDVGVVLIRWNCGDSLAQTLKFFSSKPQNKLAFILNSIYIFVLSIIHKLIELIISKTISIIP